MVSLANTDWLLPREFELWPEPLTSDEVLTSYFRGGLTFHVNYTPLSPLPQLEEERRIRLVFPDGTSWEGRGKLTDWEVDHRGEETEATLRFQL